MARRTAKPFSITALAFAAALCPALGGAQSTIPAGGPGGVERRPSLLVSVAASPVGLDDWRPSDGPALVGSVQGRLNRFLVLEGEVTRWTAVDDFGFPGYFGGGESSYYFQHRHREVWTVGSNVLLRAGTSRVTGFAGAGLGVRSSREAHSSSFRCPPGPRTPSTCTGEEISTSDHWTSTGLTEQFLVGGEFWITPRLAAYGGARFAFAAEDFRTTAGYAPHAGLRVALRTSDVVREPTRVPDPTRAQGKDVRITLNDGTSHRGKLDSITGSVVTIAGTTMPLADVRKIEKVGHATRKAASIGFLAFAPTVLVLGPAFDMGSSDALAIAAAGVGSGIGVGAVIDAVRKPGNVVYVAPGSSASFAVKPILTKDRKGVTFVTNW
jgi:hypothetical protein